MLWKIYAYPFDGMRGAFRRAAQLIREHSSLTERRFFVEFVAICFSLQVPALVWRFMHRDGSDWQMAWFELPVAFWALAKYICQYKPHWFEGLVVPTVAACAVMYFADGRSNQILVLLCLTCYWIGAEFWNYAPQPTQYVSAPPPPATTFGSAQWGTFDYMLAHRLVDNDGIQVGYIPTPNGTYRLRYRDDRHLLSIAPTGSGKGVTAIIPNLLEYPASCLVVDPKGENAIITAAARARMGHSIHIVDPWNIASEAGPSSRFNPMDWLVIGDPEIADNAMILADSLVMKDKDSKADPFWSDEAKRLLQGFILYVATDQDEAGQRHLSRVRDLLLLGGDDLTELFQRMYQSRHHVVSATGAASLQKDEKVLSSVLASAQSHTHFLDSPRLRENLSASDFRFEDLKSGPTTIYLVLPADRLDAFGRWLRLLIQQAITVNARDCSKLPERPVLFIIDEMAALGHLAKVEQAYSLMRGFGLQMWGIIQYAGQLKEIYGDSWEGFISNSGAITYQGSRDYFGAEYFSKLCGIATVPNFSFSQSHSFTQGAQGASGTSGSSFTTSQVQRNLINPDELMRMSDRTQLVFMGHHWPFLVRKVPWFENPKLQQLGRNTRLEQSLGALGQIPSRLNWWHYEKQRNTLPFGAAF